MTPTSEAIQTSSDAIDTQKKDENLDEFLSTNEQLDQIKLKMDDMIDAMAFNPSLITRAANYWYTFPLWQKIVAGVLVIVPIFLIGILASVPIMIAVSIVLLIAYTVSSILLDNHSSSNTNSTANLKSGIGELTNALGRIILSLSGLHKNLAEKIESFKQEIQHLSENVDELKGEIQQLEVQNQRIKETEKALRLTQTGLEQTVTDLSGAVKNQTELYDTALEQLHQTQQTLQEHQNQLSIKIKELTDVKQEMSENTTKQGQVIQVLQDTLKAYTGMLMQDEVQRNGFIKKLETFIDDEKKGFGLIAEHFQTIGSELAQVKEELKITQQALEASHQRYSQLLDLGEKQIKRLEALPSPLNQEPSPSNSQKLQNFGLYAVNNNREEDNIIPNADHSYGGASSAHG